MKIKLSGLVFSASILLVAGCTTTQAGPSAPANPSGPKRVETPAPQPVETPAAQVPVTATPKPTVPPYNPNGLPYGIKSSQTPAPLVLSDFTVDPPSLRLFGTSNISVVVTNTGTLPVSYGLTLGVMTASGGQRANITPSNTQMVDLAGGESKTVSFNITGLGNGTHIVYIDQLWDRLSVDSQV